MTRKFVSVALLALSSAWPIRAHAGSDMVIDNYPQTPPPVYNYAPPPPPPVYYVPRPVSVVIYPAHRYYVRPVRVFGFHREYRRGDYCPPN